MPHRNIRSYRTKGAKTDLDVCTSRQPDLTVYSCSSLPRRVHLGRVINRAQSVDSTLDNTPPRATSDLTRARDDSATSLGGSGQTTGNVRNLRKLFTQKSLDLSNVTQSSTGNDMNQQQQQMRAFLPPPPPATLHLRRVYDDIMNSNFGTTTTTNNKNNNRAFVKWAPETFALISPVNANHVTMMTSPPSPKPPRYRQVTSPSGK